MNDSTTTTTNNSTTSTTSTPLDAASVDGTPFSVLLSQAVKLKSAQDATLKCKFESFPTFYQNSIYPRDDVKRARGDDSSGGGGTRNNNIVLSFEQRMENAMSFKQCGNVNYQHGKYSDAMVNYEKAMAVFRYLVNTNPNWKNEVRVRKYMYYTY